MKGTDGGESLLFARLDDDVTEIQQKQYIVERFLRGSLNKFPDFFRMGTFIDSTHMKL